MKKRIGPKLTIKQEVEIVSRWKTSKFNSAKVIAEEFNCSQNQINKIINKYLSTKIRP